MRFGVAGIHAEHFVGEERGLVAAGAGADFEDDVFFVVGILGNQQDFQVRFHLADKGLELGEFFLRVGAHVGIFFFGDDGLALGDAAGEVLVLAVLFDDGRDFAVRLGGLLVLGRIGNDLRRGEGLGQFLVAGFDLVEAFKHKGSSRFSVLGSQSDSQGRSVPGPHDECEQHTSSQRDFRVLLRTENRERELFWGKPP